MARTRKNTAALTVVPESMPEISVEEANAEVAAAVEASKEEVAKPVKVCKKNPSHGEHRVTRTGSYCYPCDRIVAEKQNAERRAARLAAEAAASEKNS